MTDDSRRALFWAPRLLCILFALFVSLFALDVFGEGLGFWRTITALIMHLIPTFAIAAALVLAWRREWTGAVSFIAVGIFFLIIARGVMAKIVFGGVPFATAALFLANWLKRKELHGNRS
jgi:hypothetical protein